MSLWSRCAGWLAFRTAGRRPIRASRRASRCSLRLELLEDRCVPTVSLVSTPGPNVVLGSANGLTDSVSVLGGNNPTGYLLVQLTAPNGNTVFEAIVGVNGDGNYSVPTAYVPVGAGAQVGGFQWSASYSGDANNSPAQAPAVSQGVMPAEPTLGLTAGGLVPLGSGRALTASASLQGGFDPTGLITFSLQAPDGSTVDTETAPVHGNGTYSTPNGYIPSGAGAQIGTFRWFAIYRGDASNIAAPSSDSPMESVGAGAPVVTVTAGGPVLLGSGAAMTASATLSQAYTPTGAILFTLTAADGVIVDTEVVPVTGTGTYTTPNGYVPSTAGTYQWQASYSGDPLNNAAVSPTGSAPQIAQSGPGLTGTPGGSVVIGSGVALTDSAILTGGDSPTGTITFTLLDPNGNTVDTEKATVNGDGTYSTPNGYVPTTTGTYQWTASYGGDSNNTSVASVPGSQPETVTLASPQLTATPGGTVVFGSGTALTDSATLQGGFNPTGTITFTLTGPGGTTVDTETAPVSGNGTYRTPKGFVPAGAGTYAWTASYGGDTNNETASAPGTQAETVNPATPTLTTTPGGTVVLGSNALLSDSATLAGAANPGGSILFTLTDPDGTVGDTETVPVTGNGTYRTPNGHLPTAPGTYQWSASYVGDGNNSSVSTPAGAAPELVQADPALATVPGGAVALGSGVPLTDSATLSGSLNATGTIKFTLIAPNGTIVDTETATVSGDGTYATPTGYTLPASGAAPGTYQWNASYSGDTDNVAVSETGAVGEQVTVSPASPTVTTTASGDLTLGTTAPTLSDSAVLSGGYNPGGKIVFTFSGPNGLSYTQTDTVTGNGTYSAAATLPTSVAVTGTYTWSAAYSGDADNNPFTETGSSANGEQTLITSAGPTLTATPGAASVTLGAAAVTLKDTATLAGGYSPTGTVTFTLLGPSGTTVDTETVAVNGNGSYATPAGYTLPTSGSVVGTYQWNVAYSGDGNNSAANDPSAANEQVAVFVASPTIAGTPSAATVTPSVSTAPLKDTAVIAGGYNPTGSVTFALIAPNGSTADTEKVTVNGNGSYTTPTGYTLPTAGTILGTYQWQVAYSGDQNNNAASQINSNTQRVTVGLASPTLNATPGGTVVLGTGAKLTDSVTMAGGVSPTGYILFALTSPNGSVVDREIALVTGNGTYTTPNGYLPSVSGTYQWSATYSGDSNNIAVNGTAASEIAKPANTPVLMATPGGAVVVGSSAALTESVLMLSQSSPTGTLTFYLFAPGVTPNATDSNNVYSDTVTVRGTGTYSTATGNHAGGYRPTGTGTLTGSYQWVTSYSGDNNDNPVSASANETVSAASPKLTAKPGATVVLGSSGKLTDSATLSGGAGPGGYILFTLTAPDGSIADSQVVAVTGNGTYSPPSGYVPSVAGTYAWTARYTGDGNNNAVSASSSETVSPATLTLSLKSSTAVVPVSDPTVLGNSVTVSGGVAPTGTITFFLFAPGTTPNATGAHSVYSVTVAVNGDGIYTTPINDGFTASKAGTYKWVAKYSGDANNNAVNTL